MELTEAAADLLRRTAKAFPGAERRRYMAETVEAFGLSQRQAERPLGWAQDPLSKAVPEVHSGITGVDNVAARGRKPCEFHWPHRRQDLRDRVKDNLQTDPTFQSTQLDGRRSAAEVRQQRIDCRGYIDEQLPTVQTIGEKLNLRGFRLRRVTKTRPPKK